jgi:hypothetical protein
VQDLAPVLVVTDDLLELGDLVGEAVAFALERGAALRQRGDLGVEPLDLLPDRLAFALGCRVAFAGLCEGLRDAFPLAVRDRQRPAERLHLGSMRGRLLRDPPPLLVDLAPSLDVRLELPFGVLELALAQAELAGHLGQAGIDTTQVLVQRDEPEPS